MTGTRKALAMAALATGTMLATTASAQLYRDPDAPVDKRAADIVGRLTLEEKAAQMQNAAPAVERLGIPPYDYWNEALHGVARSGEATVFPQAIGMAATFDRDLLYREGRTVAIEGRAKYNQAQRERNYDRYYGLTFWSPNINIFRDPRWGRGQETLGEDPYLTGTLATEFIKGVQGDDPHYLEAIATPKHYAVHSGPEKLRHEFNVDPSPRDLTETYLPAFRRTIVDGKARSLMCAYNAVDGTAACANERLMQDILRDDWGFTGFITSDCGAIDDILNGHHNADSMAEAAAMAVKAGTDSGCDFKDEMLALPEAVRKGHIDEAVMDRALERLFAARIRLGMFDPAERVPFSAIPFSANHSPAHRALALRAARESIVLLKNDGVLPIADSAGKIAVVGPAATALIGLEGNYNGTPVGAALPLDGIGQAFGTDRVAYAQGAPFAEQVPVMVPRTAFPGGLTATFYDNAEFAGDPVATKSVPAIDVNWSGVAPAPGVAPETFFVRWSGRIAPPAPGDYEFALDMRRGCNGGTGSRTYTIHIAGAPDHRVTRSCSGEESAAEPMTVHFADTKPRAFSVELAQRSAAPGSITFAWKAPLDALRDQAVQTARDADVVVAFVGLNAWLEGEEMPLEIPGFDGGDRTSIALPAAQRQLLDALEATGKPVVIVLQSGSAVALGDSGDRAGAVLQAWYPGEQGGRALGDVLSGKVNPSGRLPVTFYESVDELPPFTDYAMQGRTYRYFDGAVEYPFGHGLSYTDFAYSGLKLGAPTVTAGDTQTVSVTIRNTGRIAGDEVAQLYLSVPGRPATPIRSLKGYERVHLAPGERRTVSFTLDPRDLAFADDKGVMRIAPATYRLWIGGGQPDTGAPGVSGAFSLTGSLALPR
ncbi:glycoside hydrolase family 3 C-terminal domain-containing protein [Stakelama saccharophila]|uniref:Glycoside hydrolase family 3 C-terminal domain-containing protein n=1 Tax=Stakelama saccharophila TaxID=3075605 RepID=A0ABZ0B9K9_9SPHN|nr:glycoside hydrolase family 3 C-terminal domain-containing protein [Stakelama sp. W311]WNO53897.1 glycoside hydrolase family 3 C-terminal domain-containing protein [Stakelama sp. W311]